MSRTDEIIHLPKRVQILTNIPKKVLVRSTHYLTKSLAIILLFVLWEVIPRLGIVEVAFFSTIINSFIGLVGISNNRSTGTAYNS